MTLDPKRHLGRRVCDSCGHQNLEWYRTRSGKWRLATPFPGTITPNPRLIHWCVVRSKKRVIRG